MEMPDVVSEIKDAERNVLYRVLAYRKLSTAELIESVRHYLSQPKVQRRTTRERKKIITIVTIHGASSGW